MGKMLSLPGRWLLGLLCLLGFLCGLRYSWPASVSQDDGGLSIYTIMNLRPNNNVRVYPSSHLADVASTRRKRPRITPTGAYTPINVDNPYAKQIAEFAVSEMNKQESQKAKLVLESVIEGQFQRVARGNYKLVIAVREDDFLPTTPSLKYEVVVFKSFEKFKEQKLTSFHQVN